MMAASLFYVAFLCSTMSVVASQQQCLTTWSDCGDIYAYGNTLSGVYKIQPQGTARFNVYCDMETEGGGWTVIQRRVNGSEDFYQPWAKYMIGFGNVQHEFWMGNLKINALVTQGLYELRIDMVGPSDEKRYAGYYFFSVGDISTKFQLIVSGYHGDAGDRLTLLNGVSFSTYDSDNDIWSSNCAASFKGAWWYTNCHSSNLNGIYNSTTYGQGINWLNLTTHYTSLKQVEMKVRKICT